MEAKLYGQNKGGTSINGIIKDYYAYAGENISAGDLVEYVNGVASKTDYGTSSDKQLSTTTNTGHAISAVKLDEKRVFIAHSYGNERYLYGLVCTVNGADISYGTDTQLGTTKYVANCISAVLLHSGKVFIAYGGESSSSGAGLKGTVVTIEGTEVKYHGYYTLSSDAYSAAGISTVLLDNGNVFVAHSYNTDRYLYGIVCTIDGFVISKGTDTAIASGTNGGAYISAVKLSENKIFIAHSFGGTNYYLYGIVCTISGTTISTSGDSKQLSSTKYTGYGLSAVALDETKVFIAHCYSSSYYLYGMVCTISGTSISYGYDTPIDNATAFTGYKISAIKLSNNKVFINYGYTSNYNLYGIIVNISGTSVNKGTGTRLSAVSYSGYTISSLLLDSNTTFIAHSNNGSSPNLYAQIWQIDEENNIPTNRIITTEYETQVRKVTTGLFDGVAKTSGLGGDDTGHNEIVSMWTKVANAIIELLGIPPLRLPQTSGKNLIDYTIHGASGGVGDRTENLADYTQAYPRNTNQKVEIDTENNAVIWSGDYFFYIPAHAQTGETLVFDCESEYRYKWALHYTDGTNATNVLNGEQITATKEVDAIMVYKTSVSTTVQNMVFKNLMLNYGEQVKEYEPYGYKIPVVSSNDTDSITTNIYLDEPLAEGENINYITDGLPDIPTLEGSTVIDVDTAVKPNPMEIKYES